MDERIPTKRPLTLLQLYELADKCISEARQAVADARQLAAEKHRILSNLE